MSLDEVVNMFFDMMRDIIENITLPTGSSIKSAILFSALTTVLSIVGTFLDLAVVDWRGALLATISLVALALTEGRGVNEVSRLYRAAKSGVAAVAQRAKGPSAPVQTTGCANPGDPDYIPFAGPNGQVNADGYAVGDNGGANQ